jgi:hypothetical protein
MTDKHKGHCFCGAVEIEAAGEPLEMGYCHCSSCRAYSGTPVTSFILWKAEQVSVVKGGELIGHFNKTGMSDRQFCSRCGGHLMAGHPGMGLTDVHAAVLPGIPFRPTVHLNYAETVLPLRDGLPKLKDFPAEVGGSGETLPE